MREYPDRTEAQEFLARKKLVETDSWRDLAPGEHAHAFTVAHSLSAGVLDDIHRLLVEYQAEGKPFAGFRADLRSLMAKAGWYGRDGIDSNAPGGERYINWRIKTIWQTNMNTSLAAGAYRQQLRTAADRPHLVYKSLLVGNRREAHKAMHDAAYPVGHEFWDMYYPPNGWGCRCDAVSMDDDDVQRYGITKIEPDVDAEFAASVPQEWRHNVGQAAFSPDFSRFAYLRSYTLPNGETALRAVKAAYRNDIQKIVLSEGELAEVLRSVVRSGHRTHSVSYPVGVLGEETSAALERVDILVDPALMATDRQLLHATRDSKRERGQAVPPLEYGTISRAINRPDSIWEDPEGTHALRGLHFVTESDDGRLIKAVFHVIEGDGQTLLFRSAAVLPKGFDHEGLGYRRVL